jgi:hypothetical protein
MRPLDAALRDFRAKLDDPELRSWLAPAPAATTGRN